MFVEVEERLDQSNSNNQVSVDCIFAFIWSCEVRDFLTVKRPVAPYKKVLSTLAPLFHILHMKYETIYHLGTHLSPETAGSLSYLDASKIAKTSSC